MLKLPNAARRSVADAPADSLRDFSDEGQAKALAYSPMQTLCCVHTQSVHPPT